MESTSSSNNFSGSPSAGFSELWNNAMIGEGLDQWTTFYVEKPVKLDPESPLKQAEIIQRHELEISVLNPLSRIIPNPRGVVYGDDGSDISPQKNSSVSLDTVQAVEGNAEATVSEANKNDKKKEGKKKCHGGLEVSTSKEAAKKKLGIFASKRDLFLKEHTEPRYDLRKRTSANKSNKCGIRRRTA